MEDTGVRCFAIAVLFFVGATVGAVSLILPHPSQFDTGGLWSNVALAYIASFTFLLARDQTPPRWLPQVGILGAHVLIARAVLLSDEPAGFYTLFWVWLGVYAFFFYGREIGVLQTLIAGALYSWLLFEINASTPVALWMMLIATMIVVGVFTDLLARRLRQAADQSAGRAKSLAAVGEVARRIARHADPDAAGPAICTAAIDVTGALGAALMEPTSDSRSLQIVSSTDPAIRGELLPFAGPPSGAVRAFTAGEPFFVADARNNPATDQRLVERVGSVSALFQPVLRDEVPIGVLVVYWDHRIAELEPEVADIVALLATEASVAIERAELLSRLERAAKTDDLTGLPNRRAWNEELAREVARAKRSGTPLTVAVLDLDRFKQYNDDHGHLAGDRFLKQVAGAWRARLRPTDVVARFGGEEFALALPDCDRDNALPLIERLREALPDDQTVSAGLSTWERDEDPATLFERADAALYAAKQAGRDRVHFD